MGAILYRDKVYGAGGSGGSGGASAISDLTDVDLDNLSDGQILKWNATTQKWENADESGGGGGGSYTRTALFESSTGWGVWDQTNGVSLLDDIENYDEIEFVLAFAASDKSKRTNKFGAKWFSDNCGYTSSAAAADHALLLLWPGQGFSAAWDSTNQKIMMWGRNGSAGLYAVYGIKY